VELDRIEVLSEATNRAVVRMPGRRFPGLVVQGDRLMSLTAAAQRLAERAAATGDAELIRLAGNLHHELNELLTDYGRICQQAREKQNQAEQAAAPERDR
jgi:hypothetical protein